MRDEAGDKKPEGEIRADPWVVTEAVATAVLEHLHRSTWLFPATLFTDGRDSPAIPRSRVGAARSETRVNHDLAEFLAWVENYCTGQGRSDKIPPGPAHPVIFSALLRLTLAWFIVRRPRGLVTAAIQYGHLRVQMTLGYAGSYDSGFPDDLDFEEWLARLDALSDAHQRLREGEQVSGPAAETYRHRVQAASRFVGRILRTERHAVSMLVNPDLQIFQSHGMTCVLDPKRAACRLRREEDGTRRTPDLDDCRPTASTSRAPTATSNRSSSRSTSCGRSSRTRWPPTAMPANSTNSTGWNVSSPRTPGSEDTKMTADRDTERDAITQAIQRLLDGRPTRSTGALTTLQLAAEAGVKRWIPTHKHVDLNEDFARRKSEANDIPPAFQHLHARAVDAGSTAGTLREDNDRLREQVAVHAQVVHELRTELDRRTDNDSQRSPLRSLPHW